MPAISFIVPAHDEAASIVATIKSIETAAQGRSFEVVVVDDASQDCTAALAAAAGARVLSVQLRQIASVRNAGAKAAHGDVFVFVDADTRIGKPVVDELMAALSVGAIGGGAMVRFDAPMPLWARVVMPVMTRAYAMLTLAAGCFVFATRDAFEATGGFDEDLYAGEELELSGALKRYAKAIQRWQGHAARFVVLPAAVETSSRKLRVHSGLRLVAELIRFVLLGRRGVQKRDKLSFWYGPRLPDPGAQAEQDRSADHGSGGDRG